MKESTGSVSAIYVVIFFVVIMFGFIISVLSYYKSYKINNSLSSIIEDYGGFSESSKEEIEKKLTTYGYKRVNITCKKPGDREQLIKFNNDKSIKPTDDNSDLGYRGYCVYIVDESPTDGKNVEYEYYSYKVTTSMTLDFGLFSFNVPIKMSAKTSTMYGCYGGC